MIKTKKQTKNALSNFLSRSPLRGLGGCGLLLLVLNGCTKTPVVEETPVAPTENNAQQRQQAIDDYNSLYLASSTTASWTGNVATCTPGTVSADMHAKTVKRINFYRKMVGLPYNMQLSTLLNEKAQKAALMMEAHGSLSHTPDASWACYSADGKEGAGKSNLAQGGIGSTAIDLYMKDYGAGNEAVGHRRWLLFSRAKTFGHGSTSNYNAIYCTHNFSNPAVAASLLPEFIAYPPKGFVVQDLFVPQQRWSFSIPDADFSTVGITVKNSDNITISTTKYPLQAGYGDNTLVFVPNINSYAFTKDTKFSVEVRNVKVGGVLKTFNYEVIFFKK